MGLNCQRLQADLSDIFRISETSPAQRATAESTSIRHRRFLGISDLLTQQEFSQSSEDFKTHTFCFVYT
ncbi:hypothetical protein JOQ06_025678 [Pogonophryne albipinna]|uniref:Uncharacterized protein n=1 Tax=Pogonophryne albipinna TaxID=1090488 RepID=A0AAD6AV68_9TELE|nr:hypothetical protein JOQ06_025678 [Pogonophryne albipinna]